MSKNQITVLILPLNFLCNSAESKTVLRNKLHVIQSYVNYFYSRMNEIFEHTKNYHIMSR